MATPAVCLSARTDLGAIILGTLQLTLDVNGVHITCGMSAYCSDCTRYCSPSCPTLYASLS
jgi:hypothetical protein